MEFSITHTLKQEEKMDKDILIDLMQEFQSYIFLRKKQKLSEEEIEDFIDEYSQDMTIIEE
jgi:hypothetical protein